MQLNYIKKIANSLKTYKLYLGLAPQPVLGPAIILFPLHNCLLCCGLAGIVTVKKAPPPPDIDPVLQLAELLEKIGKNDLQTILSGSLATEFYLNGGGYLEEMECYVRSLKTDENFQRLFFNSGNIRRLSDLVGQMKDFLSQEE